MDIGANMKILVTGADGFIGSHLVEMLVDMNMEVSALVQYNSFGNYGWLDNFKNLEKIRIISGDIRDENFCRSITKGVDIVFHLAALIAIPYSYSSPASYFDVNAKGTLNMCLSSLDAGVSKFIHTSTSEVYGTAKYVPIDEFHPLQAQSPYSASKIAADAIVTSFCKSYALPAVIARPFNTYGPRQSARAIIPSILIQAFSGDTRLKLGDLTPTRDFNFVKDTCAGLFALSRCDQAIGEVVNIGSNSEISIKDLLVLISEIIDVPLKTHEDLSRLRPLDSEVYRLKCDNSKIKSLTNFTSKYNLHEGLRETVDWFKDPRNLEKYKSNIYNV